MTNFSQGTTSGDFNIGALISESLGVLNSALPRFLALAVIPVIPLFLEILIVGEPTVEAAGQHGFTTLFLNVAFLILTFAIQGAMIYGAFNELRGQGFTVGEALSKGLSRFLPLLGVAILSGLAISIGMLLLVIPGLWLFCVLYLAAAVCVVEQRGVTDSMSRSGELTKGYRWQILGLILIIGIASALIAFILSYIGARIAGFVVGQLIGNLVQIYMGALGGVLVAIVYYRLRTIKEGVDIDKITHVFD